MKTTKESLGWISLHRQITSWEWYQDASTARLFIHLLLLANHEPRKWRGIDILRGQHLTSLETLASELKLSVQSIRTAIKHLKSTNDITIQSTSHYTLVTLTHYDIYQSVDKKSTSKVTKQLTGNQQASNKQLTTNNNYNNDNNVININKGGRDDVLEILDYYNQVFNRQFTSIVSFETNCLYWLGIHGKEKIKLAIDNSIRDNFWRDKMTPEVLFRRKNPKGELVDRVQELSERQAQRGAVGII